MKGFMGGFRKYVNEGKLRMTKNTQKNYGQNMNGA